MPRIIKGYASGLCSSIPLCRDPSFKVLIPPRFCFFFFFLQKREINKIIYDIYDKENTAIKNMVSSLLRNAWVSTFNVERIVMSEG